jgi:flavodoxin
MKTLILFRSHFGNTKQVAEAMARKIRSTGNEADVQDIRQRLPDLRAIDALVIGAPTRMGRVTHKARSVLGRLKKKGFGDKPVAVFDTIGTIPTTPAELEKSRKWFEPGAVGIMKKISIDHGLTLFPDTLRCEVSGMRGPLAENAIANAEAFAAAFVLFAQNVKRT